jgi:putative ABC transport system permease protein
MTFSNMLREFIAHVPAHDIFYTTLLLMACVIAMLAYRLEIVYEAIISFGRVFIQLAIVGGLLLVFFQINDPVLNGILCLFMVLVAGITAAEQSPQKNALWVSIVGQSIAAVVTILPMTLLGVIELRASFFLPITAMVIRNTLNRAALAFERLDREMAQNRDVIEQYLALGVDPKTASGEIVNQSIEASMIPTLNKNKVVGLVGIPGLMTGMIISGGTGDLIPQVARAVSLQAIVLYLIFVASMFSSMIVCSWMRRYYFNEREQLVIPERD